MSGAFWLGYFTVPLLLLGICLVWGAYSIASNLWNKIHVAWCVKVPLAKDKARVDIVDGKLEIDSSDSYVTSANLIRDALLESPKLYSMHGLGWRIMLVRDIRDKK
jgi:hypothetical protein